MAVQCLKCYKEFPYIHIYTPQVSIPILMTSLEIKPNHYKLIAVLSVAVQAVEIFSVLWYMCARVFYNCIIMHRAQFSSCNEKYNT